MIISQILSFPFFSLPSFESFSDIHSSRCFPSVLLDLGFFSNPSFSYKVPCTRLSANTLGHLGILMAAPARERERSSRFTFYPSFFLASYLFPTISSLITETHQNLEKISVIKTLLLCASYFSYYILFNPYNNYIRLPKLRYRV